MKNTSSKFLSGAKFLSLALFLIGGCGPVFSQRQIALTIDDLPLNGPSIGIKKLQSMTGKLVTVIEKKQIPAVGFVNESLLYRPGETDARIGVLKMWTDAKIELGNHTFSHLGFKNASLADYEDDYVRGETVIRTLIKPDKIRYFRHPFLQMGATRELEEAFEKFIGERGSRAVPVTLDTLDWMFLAAYAGALKNNNEVMKKQVSADYLKFIGLKIDYAEKVSSELFGRNVRQILLLHANELNAANFEAVIDIFSRKGYQFITVEEALKDEIYKFPDEYAPTSDWLSLWALSRHKNLSPPPPPEYIQKAYQGK